ncbi:MAG: cupin domain-containing protein [Verrucomicrobia bacterium]|nr:cupin domain-containing protein [Verrucomicrobiota bacterium]
MKTLTFRCALLALCLAGAVSLSAADQPSFTRKVLVEQDLTTPGRHGTLSLATLAPGAVTPRHKHPGEEFAYILEGTVVLEVEGQAPRTLQADEAVIVPAGVAHVARNAGTGPVKILSTYFLEAGQPLAIPVK